MNLNSRRVGGALVVLLVALLVGLAGAGALALLLVAALDEGVEAAAQAALAFHGRGGRQGCLQLLFVLL